MSPSPLATIKPPWQACVLVCSKCTKKAAGRDNDKKKSKRIFKTLRNALRQRFGKKGARLVPVGCLDLCPKERIVVGLTSAAAPLKLVVARADAPAEEILAALLPLAPVP